MGERLIARGTQIVAAVAQFPGGTSGNLATLAPLAFLDGSPIEFGDFPENDLVFWIIRNRDFSSNLSPGTVVLASVEETDHSSLPNNPSDRHIYRTEAGSVRSPLGTEVCEILQRPNAQIQHPRELLGASQIVVDHRPTPRVYVQTDEDLYGPFSTEARATDETNTYYAINLKPVYEYVDVFPVSVLSGADFVKEATTLVSLRPIPPNRSNQNIRCTYHFLLEEGLTALNGSAKQSVQLKTPEQILRPLTKRFFQVGRFRSAAEQFDEFVNQYAERDSTTTAAQADIIEAVRSASISDKRMLRDLADGLLDSGFLSEMFEERLRGRLDEHISSKSTELSAQIKERTQEQQKALDAIERRLTDRQAEFDQLLREQREVITTEKTVFEANRDSELHKIALEKAELNTQRQVVANYLESTVERFNTDRDKVISELLTILPLLDRGQLHSDESYSPHKNIESDSVEVLELPPAIRNSKGTFVRIPEKEFFDRFCTHVEASGFRYREIDLLAFHLNFKSSDFFVLGGLSGTGKSSLPQLYAEALAGEAGNASSRLLRIPVNPTWLEVADLLGRVNILDRSFNPSETGLVRHLAYAAMESMDRGQDSGMWPVVLDEMNLAQVEHYFGPFVQMFGSDQSRELRIFDSSVIKKSDPFAFCSSIRLPRTLRFIGTINFDETTKPLSPRLLDRAAIMSMGIAPRSASVTLNKEATGSAILQRNIDEWRETSSLAQSEAALLDNIQTELTQLGCPLNPRRRKAIYRFIDGVSSELCSTGTAFDLVIAQRVLPHVRGLFRSSLRSAFESLSEKILGANLELPESERILSEVREREDSGATT